MTSISAIGRNWLQCMDDDVSERLFSSVFSNPSETKKIIELLANRRYGYTRKDIGRITGLVDNGLLSKMLGALVTSDFIIRYVPFGSSRRDEHYKLIDPFCLFYLRYVKDRSNLEEDFWLTNITSPSISSWRGYAFEEVCLRHIDKIKKALGIFGVMTHQSAWTVKGNEETEGSQVDLIIERKDGIVNLCEMKFYNEEFAVSKTYDRILIARYNRLKEMVKKRQTVNTVLITTYGLTYNEYSGNFQNVITLDDLFES